MYKCVLLIVSVVLLISCAMIPPSESEQDRLQEKQDAKRAQELRSIVTEEFP